MQELASVSETEKERARERGSADVIIRGVPASRCPALKSLPLHSLRRAAEFEESHGKSQPNFVEKSK